MRHPPARPGSCRRDRPGKTAAPAAAPNSAAAQAAKAKQEEQDRLAREAKQREDAQKRGQDAQKQAQKIMACIQQLQKDHPDGGRTDPVAFQKEYLACVGVPAGQ